MSDAEVAAPAEATPVKKGAKTAKTATKKKSKNKGPPKDHPMFKDMIKDAITALKERGGSSRQAILKHIVAHYNIKDQKAANAHLKMALRAGVKNGTLKQAKGTGASGSFKMGEAKTKSHKAKPKAEKKAAKPKKAAAPKGEKKAKKAKKPKPAKSKPAKKVKTPKKAAAKKPKKGAKSPKKAKKAAKA